MEQREDDEFEDDTRHVIGTYSTEILVAVVVVVVGIGTVVYHGLEDWSWIDSFYFSVVTLSTVGYGDMAPSTDASKLFTVAYLATGISLLGASVNEIMKRRQRRQRRRRARRAHRG